MYTYDGYPDESTKWNTVCECTKRFSRFRDVTLSKIYARLNHFIEWYIFFHKLAVKQGNDINFTDEHTPKFVKLMSVGPGLILIDALTLYHIWSYAQQTKRMPLMKVCLKPCSLFVIQVQDPRNLFTADLNPYSF